MLNLVFETLYTRSAVIRYLMNHILCNHPKNVNHWRYCLFFKTVGTGLPLTAAKTKLLVIMTGVVWEMATHEGTLIFRQWHHLSLNSDTYHTTYVCVYNISRELSFLCGYYDKNKRNISEILTCDNDVCFVYTFRLKLCRANDK